EVTVDDIVSSLPILSLLISRCLQLRQEVITQLAKTYVNLRQPACPKNGNPCQKQWRRNITTEARARGHTLQERLFVDPSLNRNHRKISSGTSPRPGLMMATRISQILT